MLFEARTLHAELLKSAVCCQPPVPHWLMKSFPWSVQTMQTFTEQLPDEHRELNAVTVQNAVLRSKKEVVWQVLEGQFSL